MKARLALELCLFFILLSGCSLFAAAPDEPPSPAAEPDAQNNLKSTLAQQLTDSNATQGQPQQPRTPRNAHSLFGNKIKELKNKPFNVTVETWSRKKHTYTTQGSRLIVKPDNHPIEALSFDGVKPDKRLVRIDEPHIENARQAYVIDPSGLNFTQGEAKATAKGNVVYKCKDWDYETQTCPEKTWQCSGEKSDDNCAVHGGWELIKRVEPGTQYTLTLTPTDPAFAEYLVNNTAPTCNDGISPCIANSTLLACRNSVPDGNGPEPHDPNTIDACTDGSGTWSTPSCGGDESVESIRIDDLNSSMFRPGDTVRVHATVHCYAPDFSNDRIALLYTNDTENPNWEIIEYLSSCPGGGYQNITFSDFVLNNSEGDHAIRVYNSYDLNPDESQTCAIRSSGTRYDDNDDVVFTVRHFTDVAFIEPAKTEYYVNETVNVTVAINGTNAQTPPGLLVKQPDQSSDFEPPSPSGHLTYTKAFRPLLRGQYLINSSVNLTNGSTLVKTRAIMRKSKAYVDITDKDYRYLDYNATMLANTSGMLDVHVEFNSAIRSAIIRQHNESSPQSLLRVEETLAANVTPSGTMQSYAINPELAFHNATFTITAKGNTLHKCKEWNFTTQTCEGNWSVIRDDLVPGQDYDLFIDPKDPAFAETIELDYAHHLNSSRDFLSDISSDVIAFDGTWSEPINETHYIRVKFREALDSSNDITIYARNTQQLNTSIDVYIANTSTLVGSFPVINDTQYYTLKLTSLAGTEDTFDLRITNTDAQDAYLEFDHIIDPATSITMAQPDAGAPGMNVHVQFVGANITSTDTVTVNTSDIHVGPLVVTDESGSAVSEGRVLSTVFFIAEDATTQNVSVNFSGTILQQPFQIIEPTAGSGNFSGAAGSVTIGDGNNGTRTFGGAIVLDSLIIPSGVTATIDTSDPDGNASNGNQGFLPAILLVDGPVDIQGTLNVSGQNGFDYNDATLPKRGGDGGPGGGGGGAGGIKEAGSGADGGDGFAGGGGSGSETGTGGDGGDGSGATGTAGTVSDGGDGGDGLYGDIGQSGHGGIDDSTDGTAGGGGSGATGYPFGSGGDSNADGDGSPAGGLGGGGGAGVNSEGEGGGGGGYGTDGSDATPSADNEPGQGGSAHGNRQIVPLAGGSGGGGGSPDTGGSTERPGGGGGGGGGSLIIIAPQNATITGSILATGGAGGAGTPPFGGGGGGGGSGGAIFIQAPNTSVGATDLSVAGGSGGAGDDPGGAGGEGRVRIDGIDGIDIPGSAGSEYIGPSITLVNRTHVGGRGEPNTNITIEVQNTLSLAEFDTTTNSTGEFLRNVSFFPNINYITLVQNQSSTPVISSGGTATFDFALDVNFTFLDNGIDITPFNFSGAQFIDTIYSDAANAVQLGDTTNGTFTSQIFNGGSSTTEWLNISWNQSPSANLPDNQAIDSNANMSGNLILYHLDEEEPNTAPGGTDAQDFSGNGHHANETGGVTFNVTGQVTRAYSFDGIDDAITTNTFDVPAQGTVEFWMASKDNPAGIERQFGNDDAFEFRMESGGDIFIDICIAGGNTQAFSNTIWNSRPWNHLAVTWDDATNNLTTYLNGELDNSVIDTAVSCAGISAPLSVGASRSPPTDFFEGTLDEFAVFNRTLSAAEIQNHFVRGARKLNLSVRSCDDNSCSGESFIDANESNPQDLNVSNNQYFQYQFDFASFNSIITAQLFNVTIGLANNTAPVAQNVTLTSSLGANTTSEDLLVTFNINDNEGDATTKTIDWRANTTSIAVLNMPFEAFLGDESTTAIDYSTFGNNATVVGATFLPNGGADGFGAYSFDGIDDNLTIPDNPSIDFEDEDFSYSIRFKTSDNPTTSEFPELMFKRSLPNGVSDGYESFLWNNSGTTEIACKIWEAGASATATAPFAIDGEWHSITCVKDSDSIDLYVDGSFEISAAHSFTNLSNTQDLHMGDPFATLEFNGSLDDARIYNRSLSADQILALFNNQTDTIDSKETTAGDTWQACITPNDNQLDGTEVCSNTLTIQEGLFVTVDSNQSNYTTGQPALINLNTTTDETGTIPTSANVTTDIIYGNTSMPQGTPWWDTNYERRIPINVTNTQDTTFNNFIINVTIDTETLVDNGQLQADCDDIRFARLEDLAQEELSYLIDSGTCNTSETSIWILIPLLDADSSSIVFLYHDNSSVSSQSSASLFNQSSSVQQYILSSVLATEPLNVVSFVDNNTINIGANQVTIDRGEIGVFTAAQISSSSIAQGSGPFMGAFNDTTTGNGQNGDSLAPLSFVGTAFSYRNDRGNPDFPIVAPFDNASVQVYNGATLVLNTTLTQGTVTELTGFGITVGNAAIVESNTPVLVKYVDGSTDNRDMFTLYPAGTDWWGVPSANLQIGALEDNTTVTILTSAGGNTSTTLDRGDGFETTGLGSEGSTPAYHITSDKPINVHQIADSDGTDATTFLPETELEEEYFLPVSAQYIAVATTEPSTSCTVFEPDGTNTTLTSGSQSRPFPNKIFFGTASDTLNFVRGTRLACDNPVYAYIEFLNSGQVGAELNIFNIKASRPTTFPAPTRALLPSEQFIFRDVNVTNSSGLHDFVFNTSKRDTGNYTAAALAEDGTLNATGFDKFIIASDNEPPNVTDLRPIANSTFNASDTIEIAANVTDNVAVDFVFANISFPNGTVQQLNLSLASGDKYNSSFTIPPLLGQYNITFVSNDTNGLVNNTETTFFVSGDGQNPLVFDVRPIENSTFGTGDSIEIAANVTDNVGVDTVLANISFPNGTIQTVTLNVSLGDKYNTSFIAPDLLGQYNITIIANDTNSNANDTVTTFFFVVDDVGPTVAFNTFVAKINETVNTTDLNETNLRIIDTFKVQYNISDNIGVDRIKLFFRNSNGSAQDTCKGIFASSEGTTGNRQFLDCFEYLEFDNTTDTQTLTRDLLLGEGVTFEQLTAETFEWEVEDFYKPIVKNYPFNESTAHFNQTLKIFGNNSMRISLPREVPTDATIYEFTARFNYTENVTRPIQAYMCNKFFPDGQPVTQSGNCTFIDQLTPDDVGGGENFDFFTSNLSLPVANGSLINASVVIIQPGETNPNNYYFPQMAEVFNASIQNVTSYSTDRHITQNFTFPLSSTSELHWIYESTTCFEFFASVNDTSSNTVNTTLESFCWQDFGANFPPGTPKIIKPEANEQFNGNFNITWQNGVDPDGNDFNITLELLNPDGTLNLTIAANNISANPGIIQRFLWNSSTAADGMYRLRVTANDTLGARRNETTTYNFTIDSTPPDIIVGDCQPDNQNPSILVTCNATITDALAGVDTVFVNLTLPNGSNVQPTINNAGSQYNFTHNATTVGDHNVLWVANDTIINQENNVATASDSFTVGTPPNVTIITPLGESYPDGSVITIVVEAEDADGIANVTGNVTAPNGTLTFIPTGNGDTQFNGDTPSDDFENDTLGTIWQTVGNTDAGQTCTVDISGIVPGAATATINGTATLLSVSTCGISSTRALQGDFNITIPFNVLGPLALDSGFAAAFSEQPTLNFANRQVFFSAGNFTGVGQVIDTYANEGNGTILQTRTNLTNTSSGIARLERSGNNFTGKLWNGTDFVIVGFAQANITSALHVQLGIYSTSPNFGNLSIAAENITIESNNRTWAHYETTDLADLYNVSIFANDTFNAINDSERTNFTIFEFNDPPSNPLVVVPSSLQTYRGLLNVTWIEVVDNENNTLQYNITLLNPDFSFNTTIASNLPNIPFPRRKFEWDTTTVADGTYLLRVDVFENDTAENKSNFDVTNDVFFIDNTPPNVTDLLPPAGTNFSQFTNITISAIVVDNIAGVDTVLANVTLPNGTVRQITLNLNASSNYTVQFNETSLLGQYNVTIIANDTVGNINDTETTFFIEQDDTPPRVLDVRPQGTSYLLNESPVFISAIIRDANDNLTTTIANLTLPDNSTSTLNMSNQEYASDEDTLLLLHFNEPNGTIQDASGTATFVTHTSGIEQNINGKFGRAVNFTSTDIIQVGNENLYDFNASESFTVEAWINLGTPGGDQEIIGKWNPSNASIPGFELHVHDSGIVGFHINYANGTHDAAHSTTDVLDGQFHHIAGVRDAANELCHVYIDGTLEGTNFCDAVDLSNLWNVTIGNHPDLSEPALGIIDEVRISNTTRVGFSPHYYRTNQSNITLRGNYSIIITGTDQFNNTNNTETGLFRRVALFQIDILQLPALGVDPFDNITFANYTTTILQNTSNILDLRSNISNQTILRVNISGHDPDSPNSTLIIDTPPAEDPSFYLYGIDPSHLSINNLTFTLNATGEEVYKCTNYNFTGRECLGNWILLANITQGELYSITIDQTDPGFLETSEAPDVSLTPLDNETLITAFVDAGENDVSFQILRTSGTTVVSTTDVDTTADQESRVDVDVINASHFIIGWVDGPDNDLKHQIWQYNGSAVSAVTSALTADTNIGLATDVSVAELGDRYFLCYSNDDDDDADYQGFNNAGTQIVSEDNVDTDINNDFPLQNFVSCTAMNSTRWSYFWFDDTSNDASYRILDETGSALTIIRDTDNNVGQSAQAATTAINDSAFVMLWYDSTDEDITFSIRSSTDTQLVAPTDIDTIVGSESRVAITPIRLNETVTRNDFVAVWWDDNDNDIKAEVRDGTGQTITESFVIESQPDATFKLLDVTSRNLISGNELCPGHFAVAYTNASDQAVFKTFKRNGSTWNGFCTFITVAGFADGANYLLNETASLQASIKGVGANDNVFAEVTYPNGTTTLFNLPNIGGNNYAANVTDLLLRGRYNVTYKVTSPSNVTKRESNSYFTRIALDLIDVVRLNNTFLEFSTNIITNNSNVINATVTLNDSRLHSFNVTNHDLNSPHSIIRIEDDAPINTSQDFDVFGIDPGLLNLSNATFSTTAIGDDTLYKCIDFNLSDSNCFGNWTPVRSITSGTNYTFTIDQADPGFLETSAVADVSVTPLNNTAFVIAFIDANAANLSFKVLDTDGSTITDTVVLDSTVDNTSRVSVDIINSTHFVIAWADGPTNDLVAATVNIDGAIALGPTTLDGNIGTSTDVSAQYFHNDRAVICNANDADNDADFRIVNVTPPGAILVGETAVDGNIAPGATLQNLIECAGNNATRWTYVWFNDPGGQNDGTASILDETGTVLLGPSNFDGNIGEIGQVATTDVDNNGSAVLWYDSASDDVTFAIADITGGFIVTPTDLDTDAGTLSRVSIAAVRENQTSQEDLFVAMWSDANDVLIEAAVLRTNGSIFSGPFNITTNPSTLALLHDVTGRDTITNQSICPGTFIAAFSNSSFQAEFLGFYLNGTAWNGDCADLVADNITFNNTFPGENETIQINGTVTNNGTLTHTNVTVQFFDGLCGAGSQINGDQTISSIGPGETEIVSVMFNATPVGPHNISLCVDPDDAIVEDNESNNNLTVVLNVNAFVQYFGTLAGNVTLDNSANNTQYDWSAIDAGNVYFADIDSNVSFENLQALTRTTSGAIATNDCQDADENLNMTGFNDSITALFCINSSHPAATGSFDVFEEIITDVPIINSTNGSILRTGILWDTSDDDGDGQYDIADREDLVFIGNISRSTSTTKGTVDYFVRVPVLLREYVGNRSRVNFFVELR